MRSRTAQEMLFGEVGIGMLSGKAVDGMLGENADEVVDLKNLPSNAKDIVALRWHQTRAGFLVCIDAAKFAAHVAAKASRKASASRNTLETPELRQLFDQVWFKKSAPMLLKSSEAPALRFQSLWREMCRFIGRLLNAGVLESFAGRASEAACPDPCRTEEPRTLPNHRTSGANGPPVEVRIQLYLAAIVQVDQKQQLLSVEGYFRQEWRDERLNSSADVGDCEDPITLDLPVRGIWQPDIYFDNSIREWYGVGSMRIYPDARVWRSVRFNHLMRCPMSFHRLPFDTQRCFILIGSYSWEVSKVNTSAFSDGPVEMPEGYDGTIEWKLVEVTSEVTTEWFGTGIHRKGYRYVTIYLSLQRRSSNLIMFSLVAYVGLFIPKAAAPARVASSVIPVTNQLPALSYLTWLTSFLVSMTLFTMSTVFEYGVVSVLMQVEARKIRKFEAFKRLTADAHRRAEEQEVSISMEDIQKTDAAVAYVYKLFDSDWAVVIFKLNLAANSFPERGSAPVMTLLNKRVQLVYKRLASPVLRGWRIRPHSERSSIWLQSAWAALLPRPSQRDLRQAGCGRASNEKKDFHRMLKDIDDYMPGKNAFKLTFWEREPADQVDIVFRWVFIIGLAARPSHSHRVGYEDELPFMDLVASIRAQLRQSHSALGTSSPRHCWRKPWPKSCRLILSLILAQAEVQVPACRDTPPPGASWGSLVMPPKTPLKEEKKKPKEERGEQASSAASTRNSFREARHSIPVGNSSVDALVCVVQNSPIGVIALHPWGPLGGSMADPHPHTFLFQRAGDQGSEAWSRPRFGTAGCTTVRFNFRGGIGSGAGSVEDVKAVAAWMTKPNPLPETGGRILCSHVLIVGYSYGSIIGAAAAAEIPSVIGYAALGPPLDYGWALYMFNAQNLRAQAARSAGKPKLLVVGTTDEFCSMKSFQGCRNRQGWEQWIHLSLNPGILIQTPMPQTRNFNSRSCDTRPGPKEMHVIEGANHFQLYSYLPEVLIG
eukprot:s513_g8.t2